MRMVDRDGGKQEDGEQERDVKRIMKYYVYVPTPWDEYNHYGCKYVLEVHTHTHTYTQIIK